MEIGDDLHARRYTARHLLSSLSIESDQAMFLALFVTMLVLGSWSRTFRPGSNRLEGRMLLAARVPLLARIRMHGLPAALSLVVVLYIAIAAREWWWLGGIATLSIMLLIAIPVSYTITDRGIRLGLSVFRRWTEFAAVRRAPGGARLIGVPKSPGMHIWLSRSRGDDEFLHYLRQTLKGAYKGTSTPQSPSTQRVALDIDGDDGIDRFSVAIVR